MSSQSDLPVCETPEEAISDEIHDASSGQEDDVSVTAKMYLTQHKGKALAKALKAGCRDIHVLSVLMKNQAVHRRVPTVLSVYVGNPDVISCLKEAGANVRFDDDALLVFAANEGFEDSVEVLLSSGCVASSKALAVAVAKKHVDIVERLTSADAKMTDRLWKSVVKRADESEEGIDILQLLSRQASGAQVQSAMKELIASERIDSIAALVPSVRIVSPQIASDAVQLLCMSSKSSAFHRLIRVLLQRGMKPTDYDAIKKDGDPMVIKLLNRYA